MWLDKFKFTCVTCTHIYIRTYTYIQQTVGTRDTHRRIHSNERGTKGCHFGCFFFSPSLLGSSAQECCQDGKYVDRSFNIFLALVVWRGHNLKLRNGDKLLWRYKQFYILFFMFLRKDFFRKRIHRSLRIIGRG